jgi:hypothetical protein
LEQLLCATHQIYLVILELLKFLQMALLAPYRKINELFNQLVKPYVARVCGMGEILAKGVAH